MPKSLVVLAASMVAMMTGMCLLGDGLGSALFRNGMFDRDPTATRLDERPFVLIMFGMMHRLLGEGLLSAFFRITGMFDRNPMAIRLDERLFVLIMVGTMYCIMSFRFFCYYDRLIDPRRRRVNNLKVLEFVFFLLFVWHCHYIFQTLHKWNWNSEATLYVKASAKILVSAENKFIRFFSSGYPALFNFICTIIGFIKEPINTILNDAMWILPLQSDIGDSTEECIVYWCIVILLFLSIDRFFRNNRFFLID